MNLMKDERPSSRKVEHGPQKSAGARNTSVTVLATWTLAPHHQPMWRSTWEELARLAVQLPTCHAFQLKSDSEGRGRHVAVSEWESPQHFNAFVRSSGVLWLDRTVACPLLPHTVSVQRTVESENSLSDAGTTREPATSRA